MAPWAFLRIDCLPTETHWPQKLIVADLGNGASIAAIRNGQGLNTSMGLTPLAASLAATRSGDIDPGVLLFILRKIAETAKDASEAPTYWRPVSKKAGLLGVSELSSDMRPARCHRTRCDGIAQVAHVAG